MKKKILLSVVFGISLLPVCMSQYGGCREVQEISGILNILNPIGIVSVVVFFAGVWVPFKKNKYLYWCYRRCGNGSCRTLYIYDMAYSNDYRGK